MGTEKKGMSELSASSAERNQVAPLHQTCVDRYWWHVNKGGFPIPVDTWERMWGYVVGTHPEGDKVSQAIRGKHHKKPAIPPPPIISPVQPVQDSLWKIQQYMQSLQYNYTGTQFFDIKKNRPLARLMDNAREIIAESLPIKCLEAVVLGLYLTSSLLHTQRLCISFKTSFRGHTYRHVVLGVQHKAQYGALGMSRRSDLMYKSLQYKTLGDLMQDFISSYQKYDHIIHKIRLSPYIAHDCTSGNIIKWKHISFNLKELGDKDLKKLMDQASRTLRSSN